MNREVQVREEQGRGGLNELAEVAFEERTRERSDEQEEENPTAS